MIERRERVALRIGSLVGVLALVAAQAGGTAPPLRWVSHAAEQALVAAGGEASPFGLGADGRFLALGSEATNLVAGAVDAAGTEDVFLWDAESGETTLVSHAAGLPLHAGNAPSSVLGASADGRYVLFASAATDLVAGASDTNGADDLFLWDRIDDATFLVSHAAGSASASGNGATGFGSVSFDGSFVAFASSATDHVSGIVDDNAAEDVFLWSRASGQIDLVSRSATEPGAAADGASQALFFSSDGAAVLIVSRATDLVAGVTDQNGSDDAFLWERLTGTMRLISRSATAAAATGNGESQGLSLSAEGRFVLFNSEATDLVAAGDDGNDASDVFLWDRDGDRVELVSRSDVSPTTAADGVSIAYWSALSADGRFATFVSTASDLVPGQVDGATSTDAFLWDRATGRVRLVSHVAGSPNVAVDALTFPSHVSADGSTVTFNCYAPAYELVPGVADPLSLVSDVFLWRRGTGTVRLLSLSATAATPSVGNGDTYVVALSRDGRRAAIDSFATDLVAGVSDTPDSGDVLHWTDPEIFADGFESGGLDLWGASAP